MIQIHDERTAETIEVLPHEIRRTLMGRGIRFDRVLSDILDSHRYDYTIGGRVLAEGIFHYFMSGDADVACYTPRLRSLIIHPQPRVWARSFLEKAKDISDRYPGG